MWFYRYVDDPDNYRKKNNINMKSMGVSGVDDNAIKINDCC